MTIRLCDSCGDQIPEKRLLAMPNTRLCRDCKVSQDESPIQAGSVFLSRSMVEGYEGEWNETRNHSISLGVLGNRRNLRE